MNCRNARNLMGAYLYGDLSPSDMKLLRLHVEDCSACRTDLESRGRTVSAIPNCFPEITDDERNWVATAARARIDARPSHTVWYMPRFSAAFGVAAVILAGIVVGSVLGQTGSKIMAAREVNVAQGAVVEITKEIDPEKPKHVVSEDNGKVARPGNGGDQPQSPRSRETILNMLRNAPVLSTFTDRKANPRDPLAIEPNTDPGMVIDEKPGTEVPVQEEDSNKPLSPANDIPKQ